MQLGAPLRCAPTPNCWRGFGGGKVVAKAKRGPARDAYRERKARDLAALSANLATYDEESAASEARVAAQMTELAAAAAQTEVL